MGRRWRPSLSLSLSFSLLNQDTYKRLEITKRNCSSSGSVCLGLCLHFFCLQFPYFLHFLHGEVGLHEFNPHFRILGQSGSLLQLLKAGSEIFASKCGISKLSSQTFKAKRRGGWGWYRTFFCSFFYVVLEIAQKWPSLFREQKKIFFFGLDSSFLLRRRRRRTLVRHQCLLNPPNFPPLVAFCQWGFFRAHFCLRRWRRAVVQ